MASVKGRHTIRNHLHPMLLVVFVCTAGRGTGAGIVVL